MKYAKFTFNPFQENTFVLYDETKEAIIIDPGAYNSMELAQLTHFVEKEDLDIKVIVNTHCHIDHVLGVADLKKIYSVPFKAHKNEQLNLDRLKFQADLFGIPLSSEAPIVDEFIDESNILEFGNTKLKTLYVPGHSPGHLAFVNTDVGIIAGGDVLFRQGIGRTDLPGCNHNDLISSIKAKLFSLPNDYMVLPGHMENTTIGYEKENNPFLKD